MFPTLEKVKRDGEYNLYPIQIKAKIIYSYLFDGLSHRELDKTFIGLDPDLSKGYQSMGVLHYLGLKKNHKHIFKDKNLEEAINLLNNEKNNDFKLIIWYLNNYNKDVFFDEEIESRLNKQIVKSKKDKKKDRKNRLDSKKNKKPNQIIIVSKGYERDPDVIVEVLKRANDYCEFCKNKAPFIRAKDNTPYLEVHHKIPLSENGLDIVENAFAICPNCHRKAHYGI